MFDLIIKNGTVYDGTGSPGRVADVGVKKDLIVEVGKLGTAAREVIDATDQWVAPGFIDIQNHSDSYWTIFDYPHQESALLQGITTIAMGNCGASLAPLPSLEALKAVQKWHSLDGANFNWQYFEEFLKTLEMQPLGVNVLSLVGHATIRRGLLGNAVRQVTDAELRVLDRLLFSSLKSGAFGLSIGLVYAHEYNSSQAELTELASRVHKADRLLSVHLRSEGSSIVESLSEIIHLTEISGARTKISHLKVRGHRNWRYFDQVLELLERAYQKKLPLTFDVYPYTTTWSVLYTYLPKWAVEGGRGELMKRLQQPYWRKKIIDNLSQQSEDFSSVIIATASSSPHLVGRSLGDIAADQGVSVSEALVNIVFSTESEVVVFEDSIFEEHLDKLLAHPLSAIATDGAGFDISAGRVSKNLIHPRCFGGMAQFLSQTRTHGLLKPEKAIRKITGLPAEILGLRHHGFLRRGQRADITVIDPATLQDLATIADPYQPPLGIRTVVVEGKTSVSEGKLTGIYAGRVLRA